MLCTTRDGIGIACFFLSSHLVVYSQMLFHEANVVFDDLRNKDAELCANNSAGGSAAAAGSLVSQLGGDLIGYLFVLEIPFLKGREKLGGLPTITLLETDD